MTYIYMDYNATTPIAHTVVNKIEDALRDYWYNPSCSYHPALNSRNAILEARSDVALMIGTTSKNITFMSGGTEANNTVVQGVPKYFNDWLKMEGGTPKKNILPHVITTNVEHDSVIQPLQKLVEQGIIDLTVVPVSKQGCLNVKDIVPHIQENTCLVTVMMANNETGVIMPIAEIGRTLTEINKVRERQKLIKILYHTDAAQAIGKIEVNVTDLHVDYLTIVGHKFYGPRIGCLYANMDKVPLYPLIVGGNQEQGYRAGTENTPMIVGLGEAARLVYRLLRVDHDHMQVMRDYLEQKIEEAFGKENVVFHCRSNEVTRLPNTCNFSLVGTGLTGPLVLSKCKHLIASVGAACHDQNKPSAILCASGVPVDLAANAIRLSIGRHTPPLEVDGAVEDLKNAVEHLKLSAMNPNL